MGSALQQWNPHTILSPGQASYQVAHLLSQSGGGAGALSPCTCGVPTPGQSTGAAQGPGAELGRAGLGGNTRAEGLVFEVVIWARGLGQALEGRDGHSKSFQYKGLP